MGTVCEPILCPECNCVAQYEMSTRTLEERSFCPFCGYRAWTRLVLDRKKMEARAPDDDKLYPKLTKGGKWQHRFYERKHVGILCWQSPESGGATLYPQKEEPHPDAVAYMKESIANGSAGKDSYLTYWNGETMEILAGTMDLDSLFSEWGMPREEMEKAKADQEEMAQAAAEALEAYKADPSSARPIEELWAELELDE